MRHTREIQGVKTRQAFAQDHTFKVVKNYPKNLGATALWDLANEKGEIACAVLVKTTKTKDFAHAAKGYAIRTHSTPQAIYSDTWPANDAFWAKLVPNVQGRLGLFRFICRMSRTLRQNHIDFHNANTDLIHSIYAYNDEDLGKLYLALQQGGFGEQFSRQKIIEMQSTKRFRE
jgi:hypothetical protein